MRARAAATTRRAWLAGLGVGLGGSLAGCLGDDEAGEAAAGAASWQSAELTDVRTGETVVLGAFDRPVMLKTFAIWCTTCDRQELHTDELLARRDDVTVVSMNIDASEDGDAVAEHAAENGYDWHFVVPPDAVIESLREEFDRAFVASPPRVPKALICPDGSFRRLEDGLMGPDELSGEFDAGC